ncbi:hypothetical protein [Mesorhizobium abyssinicae]|uniref:hypothetical protein n=1 Tax=Mesorhizobium abyssinicae TaxID=1209958 RepID=UPI003390FF7A
MAELPNVAEFDFVVEIPPQFDKYVDSAMLRLQVHHPAWRIARLDGAISIGVSGGLAEEELRKTVLYTVYREKIYAETLVMRQALMSAVTSR